MNIRIHPINNELIIEEMDNTTIDFFDLLKKRDSIKLLNCDNLVIKMTSKKMNHIEIINCYNINIDIPSLISGLFIQNCNNIKIKAIKSKFNNIDIIRSNEIEIEYSENNFKSDNVNVYKSKNIYIIY